MKSRILIKICGLTSVDQALQIASLDVDAIGVISVKESPRYVSLEKKKAIFESLQEFYPKLKRVSVVKNLPISSILSENIWTTEGTVLQLHGDEDLSYCKRLKQQIPTTELWKAFRIKEKKDLEKIKPFENIVDAIMLDSWVEGKYGGTGIRIKAEYLEDISFTKPWWLAGGISINCLDEIYKNIRIDGLDISSSIEISPGIKDMKKTKAILSVMKEIKF